MKTGQKVRYIGCSDEQFKWGRGKDPRPVLMTNGFYIIERIEIHSWHTKVWLEYFGGPYNSVCFEEV